MGDRLLTLITSTVTVVEGVSAVIVVGVAPRHLHAERYLSHDGHTLAAYVGRIFGAGDEMAAELAELAKRRQTTGSVVVASVVTVTVTVSVVET